MILALQRLVAIMLPSLLIVACTTSSPVSTFSASEKVWPAAPQQARIAFVTEFSDIADLGIRPSMWESFLNLTAGADDNRMVRQMAVVATSDAQIIFVADPDANCIHRYDLLKSRYRCLGAEDGGAVRAVGLTIIDDEWLVASDSSRGILLKGRVQGKTLEPFYASQDLEQPTGVYWNKRTKRLYVADTGQQSLLEFDENGSLKRKIGMRGSASGQFNFPTYVWADSRDEVLVTDSLNFRLQRFDRDGQFLSTFGENGDLPGDFARPKGVATDGFGHVYVIDALMHMLQVFSRDGELLMSVGSQGNGDGEFWLPNGIFITPDNTIFVADSYNRRVQVFRYVGPES